MKKKVLKNYETAVNDIIESFCVKQGLDFEYWAADCVGEVACFGGIFLNFDDIIHDLKNNAPKGLIIDWYNEQFYNENQKINYRSYIMGAKVENLKNNKNDFYNKLKNIHGIIGLEIRRSCYRPKEHLYVEVSRTRCTSNEAEEVQKMLKEQNWFEWTFTLVL